MSDSAHPGKLRAWILASRPKTLGAALAPVLVGAAVAWAAGGLRPGPTLLALVLALLIQISSNFANDVFDYEKGADSGERLGPQRAVQAGWITPAAMRRALWLVCGVAFLGGCWLAWMVGWPIVLIGVLSLIAALAYTGGPYPLGYHGLGDLFVILFFGFVAVCGTAYVSLGNVPDLAWWAAVPPGALATAILVVNNLRDRVGDAAAGKRTLAVRWGRSGAEAEYAALLLAAYTVPLALLLLGYGGPLLLLPWLSAPLAFSLWSQVRTLEGKELNAVLVRTARLLVIFSLLFATTLAFGTALAFATGPAAAV